MTAPDNPAPTAQTPTAQTPATQTPTTQTPTSRFSHDYYEERTDFAWTRSGIALLAAAAVFARRVWVDEFRADDTFAFLLFGLAAVGWCIGVFGWNGRHRQAETPHPRSATEMLAVTIGTVALAASGLIVTFVNS